MNAIESLELAIREVAPLAATHLRRPKDPAGEWWLDVRDGVVWIAIQWRPSVAAMVFQHVASATFGEGPDETFPTYEDVLWHVADMLG